MLLHQKIPPVLTLLALSALALILAACLPAEAGSAPAAQEPSPTETTIVRPAPTVSTDRPAKDPPTPTPYPTPVPESAQRPPENCPVTRPPQPRFVPPEPWPERPPDGGAFWYGSKDLWTSLPGDGTWPQLARGEKVFWWREGFDGSIENRPALGMTARRLDGAAPEARSDPPATNAYHPSFHWAILTGFELPTTGCWEITGRYHGHELTFVTWVPPR